VWSGTAAHQVFVGGNARKLRRASASSTATAAMGSGGLHMKEHDVRTSGSGNRRTQHPQWHGGAPDRTMIVLDGVQRRDDGRWWTWWSSRARPSDLTRRTRQAGGSSPTQKGTEARRQHAYRETAVTARSLGQDDGSDRGWSAQGIFIRANGCRTLPPSSANQDVARADTDIDRWAPFISGFSFIKISRNQV
jgi:hypothetical protein